MYFKVEPLEEKCSTGYAMNLTLKHGIHLIKGRIADRRHGSKKHNCKEEKQIKKLFKRWDAN